MEELQCRLLGYGGAALAEHLLPTGNGLFSRGSVSPWAATSASGAAFGYGEGYSAAESSSSGGFQSATSRRIVTAAGIDWLPPAITQTLHPAEAALLVDTIPIATYYAIFADFCKSVSVGKRRYSSQIASLLKVTSNASTYSQATTIGKSDANASLRGGGTNSRTTVASGSTRPGGNTAGPSPTLPFTTSTDGKSIVAVLSGSSSCVSHLLTPQQQQEQRYTNTALPRQLTDHNDFVELIKSQSHAASANTTEIGFYHTAIANVLQDSILQDYFEGVKGIKTLADIELLRRRFATVFSLILPLLFTVRHVLTNSNAVGSVSRAASQVGGSRSSSVGGGMGMGGGSAIAQYQRGAGGGAITAATSGPQVDYYILSTPTTSELLAAVHTFIRSQDPPVIYRAQLHHHIHMNLLFHVAHFISHGKLLEHQQQHGGTDRGLSIVSRRRDFFIQPLQSTSDATNTTYTVSNGLLVEADHSQQPLPSQGDASLATNASLVIHADKLPYGISIQCAAAVLCAGKDRAVLLAEVELAVADAAAAIKYPTDTYSQHAQGLRGQEAKGRLAHQQSIDQFHVVLPNYFIETLALRKERQERLKQNLNNAGDPSESPTAPKSPRKGPMNEVALPHFIAARIIFACLYDDGLCKRPVAGSGTAQGSATATSNTADALGGGGPQKLFAAPTAVTSFGSPNALLLSTYDVIHNQCVFDTTELTARVEAARLAWSRALWSIVSSGGALEASAAAKQRCAPLVTASPAVVPPLASNHEARAAIPLSLAALSKHNTVGQSGNHQNQQAPTQPPESPQRHETSSLVSGVSAATAAPIATTPTRTAGLLAADAPTPPPNSKPPMVPISIPSKLELTSNEDDNAIDDGVSVWPESGANTIAPYRGTDALKAFGSAISAADHNSRLNSIAPQLAGAAGPRKVGAGQQSVGAAPSAFGGAGRGGAADFRAYRKIGSNYNFNRSVFLGNDGPDDFEGEDAFMRRQKYLSQAAFIRMYRPLSTASYVPQLTFSTLFYHLGVLRDMFLCHRGPFWATFVDLSFSTVCYNPNAAGLLAAGGPTGGIIPAFTSSVATTFDVNRSVLDAFRQAIETCSASTLPAQLWGLSEPYHKYFAALRSVNDGDSGPSAARMNRMGSPPSVFSGAKHGRNGEISSFSVSRGASSSRQGGTPSFAAAGAQSRSHQSARPLNNNQRSVWGDQSQSAQDGQTAAGRYKEGTYRTWFPSSTTDEMEFLDDCFSISVDPPPPSTGSSVTEKNNLLSNDGSGIADEPAALEIIRRIGRIQLRYHPSCGSAHLIVTPSAMLDYKKVFRLYLQMKFAHRAMMEVRKIMGQFSAASFSSPPPAANSTQRVKISPVYSTPGGAAALNRLRQQSLTSLSSRRQLGASSATSDHDLFSSSMSMPPVEVNPSALGPIIGAFSTLNHILEHMNSFMMLEVQQTQYAGLMGKFFAPMQLVPTAEAVEEAASGLVGDGSLGASVIAPSLFGASVGSPSMVSGGLSFGLPTASESNSAARYRFDPSSSVGRQRLPHQFTDGKRRTQSPAASVAPSQQHQQRLANIHKMNQRNATAQPALPTVETVEAARTAHSSYIAAIVEGSFLPSSQHPTATQSSPTDGAVTRVLDSAEEIANAVAELLCLAHMLRNVVLSTRLFTPTIVKPKGPDEAGSTGFFSTRAEDSAVPGRGEPPNRPYTYIHLTLSADAKQAINYITDKMLRVVIPTLVTHLSASARKDDRGLWTRLDFNRRMTQPSSQKKDYVSRSAAPASPTATRNYHTAPTDIGSHFHSSAQTYGPARARPLEGVAGVPSSQATAMGKPSGGGLRAQQIAPQVSSQARDQGMAEYFDRATTVPPLMPNPNIASVIASKLPPPAAHNSNDNDTDNAKVVRQHAVIEVTPTRQQPPQANNDRLATRTSTKKSPTPPPPKRSPTKAAKSYTTQPSLDVSAPKTTPPAIVATQRRAPSASSVSVMPPSANGVPSAAARAAAAAAAAASLAANTFGGQKAIRAMPMPLPTTYPPATSMATVDRFLDISTNQPEPSSGAPSVARRGSRSPPNPNTASASDEATSTVMYSSSLDPLPNQAPMLAAIRARLAELGGTGRSLPSQLAPPMGTTGSATATTRALFPPPPQTLTAPLPSKGPLNIKPLTATSLSSASGRTAHHLVTNQHSPHSNGSASRSPHHYDPSSEVEHEPAIHAYSASGLYQPKGHRESLVHEEEDDDYFDDDDDDDDGDEGADSGRDMADKDAHGDESDEDDDPTDPTYGSSAAHRVPTAYPTGSMHVSSVIGHGRSDYSNGGGGLMGGIHGAGTYGAPHSHAQQMISLHQTYDLRAPARGQPREDVHTEDDEDDFVGDGSEYDWDDEEEGSRGLQ